MLGLPYRGVFGEPRSVALGGLALPPEPMPARQGLRPLKAWRYVGVFGPAAMLCVARAAVGPALVSWWAVWDRETGTLTERTRRSWRGVEVGPGRAGVRDGEVRIELATAAAGRPVELTSPHGRQYAWTRKMPLRVTGEIVIGERRIEIAAAGLLDESAGYHARRTAWRWCAGAGVAESGAAIVWNLVEGLHDGRERSERAVWIGGEPHALEPQPFDGLAGVGGLRFTAEATRARRENLLLIASDYEQPFGTFTGSLPVAGPLREGWGVMERHTARW
jgi:hypothetical protein